MNYKNISIVHLEQGLDVSFNGHDTNKEVVFSFDSNKKFIQKFTYPVDICSPKIKNILTNTNSKIHIRDECFFYYSFYFQISYAHYLTQCLPKLNYYLNELDKTLVIPRSSYTNLCKDICNLLELDNTKILILEDNVEYSFDNIQTVDHIGSEWDGVGGEVNNSGVSIYEKLRDSLGLSPNKTPHRKVYLKRDGKKNLDYGNGEVGIFRKIDNENELIDLLTANGFEIIELGTKRIEEKSECLKDIHTVITQIGANCMNLIFSNSIKNVLLLSNDSPIGQNYYFDIIDKLNPINSNKKMFISRSSDGRVDPKNTTNRPFSVDLNEIQKYLCGLEK